MMFDRDEYEKTMALGAYVYGGLAILALIFAGAAFADRGLVFYGALSAGTAWAGQFVSVRTHDRPWQIAQFVLTGLSALLWLIGVLRLVA